VLAALAARLRQATGIEHKQDIQPVARALAAFAPDAAESRLGDDCAAIPDRDGYLLLAAEGMLPALVAADPWFAGWCGVLVNVSDIAAMGGRAIAVVDALWSQSDARAALLWEGAIAASRQLNVPIVGGHANCRSPYDALAVAILGRAERLMTSFDARAGDALVLLADLAGKPRERHPYCWDAATTADAIALQRKLALLPELAESGLCRAGKDISMGGILGTALMLLETSECGAKIDLDRIPTPPALSLEQWLTSFPSYGFLLSLPPENLEAVRTRAEALALTCAAIGCVTAGSTLLLEQGDETACFWDLAREPLTGFRS